MNLHKTPEPVVVKEEVWGVGRQAALKAYRLRSYADHLVSLEKHSKSTVKTTAYNLFASASDYNTNIASNRQ